MRKFGRLATVLAGRAGKALRQPSQLPEIVCRLVGQADCPGLSACCRPRGTTQDRRCSLCATSGALMCNLDFVAPASRRWVCAALRQLKTAGATKSAPPIRDETILWSELHPSREIQINPQFAGLLQGIQQAAAGRSRRRAGPGPRVKTQE